MHPEPDRNLARRQLARHRVLLGAGIVVGLVVSAFVIEAFRSPEGHGASSAAPVPAPAVPDEPDSEQRRANAPAPAPMPARIASAPELATVNAPSIQPTAATNITPDLPPLAQRIAELTRRADAGDMVASCMLGMELQHCAERRRVLYGLRFAELSPLVVRTASTAEKNAATRATLARLERHCSGVPTERIAEAPRRLIDAADRGNGAAAGLALVRGQEWVSARLATEPELIARFRDGYPRWVDAALQAQDPEAARAILATAMYGSPMDLGFQALMRDSVALRALDLALVRVAHETGEYYGELPAARLVQSEATLDAVAKVRAEALGQLWYEAMMRFPDDNPETETDTDAAPDGVSWAAPVFSPVAAMHGRCERG